MNIAATLSVISILILVSRAAPVQECKVNEYIGGTSENPLCVKCPSCLVPYRLNKPCNNKVKFPKEKFTCQKCLNGTCLFPNEPSAPKNSLSQPTTAPSDSAIKITIEQIDLKYYWVYGLVIVVVFSLIFGYLWYCNGQRRKRLKEESHIDADDVIWMDDILTESSSVFDAKDCPQRRPLFFNRPIVLMSAPLQTPTMPQPAVPFFEVEA